MKNVDELTMKCCPILSKHRQSIHMSRYLLDHQLSNALTVPLVIEPNTVDTHCKKNTNIVSGMKEHKQNYIQNASLIILLKKKQIILRFYNFFGFMNSVYRVCKTITTIEWDLAFVNCISAQHQLGRLRGQRIKL